MKCFVLCDDGVIPESQVILEYLEERFPDARRLLPQTAKERAHTRLLSRVVGLYLMPPIVSLASPGISEEQRRSYVQAVMDALHIVGDLMGTSLYAAGEELSLADCVLAPALFAARVAGERHGFNVLAEHENLKRYVATIEQHKDVGRVLREMAEGLRRMEEMSST